VSKKLEQKQQRRQAEEQRKKELQRAARRRNLITAVIIALVATTVVGAIYYQRQSESGPVGVAAAAAGCNEIQRPEELDQDHVPDGEMVDYNTDPPTSGPHYAQWVDPPDFFPPGALDQIPRERFVHNLEHGQIVFWYRPDAPESVVDDIHAYINKQSGTQEEALLATPYEGVDSSYSFTMTAWGGSQSCAELSEEVAGRFREDFQGRGPENPQIEMATFDYERDG
jgi:hypothetical protein